VTGLPGAHVVEDVAKATVSSDSIRRYLGIPDIVEVRGPRGGKMRCKKEESVSPEVVEKLNKIKNSLRMYLPEFYIEPYGDKVTMRRCICTLDAVLSRMYGCSFRKEGTDNYVLRRLALFDETSPVKQRPWSWGGMDLDQDLSVADKTEEIDNSVVNIARYREQLRLGALKDHDQRIHRECMKKRTLATFAKGTKDIRGFGILKI
jgi:hypothetical protein